VLLHIAGPLPRTGRPRRHGVGPNRRLPCGILYGVGALDAVAARASGGAVVESRPSGSSMVPLIRGRQLVTVAPVDPAKVEVGDIVLARVAGRVYLHLVPGTHVYWRADATIAAEAIERAIPTMVAVVAAELPAAAVVVGLDPGASELNWSLASVGTSPKTDDEARTWSRQQRG
jgi:hypothetical protein